MAKKSKGDPPRPRDDRKPEEFERFEDLAGKLLRVSKSELNEKRRGG